jgi:hypothetical protein
VKRFGSSAIMPKHLLPFEVCEVWGIESRK